MTDFDFRIVGLSEDDEIIALVDDEIYGACTYAVKEDSTTNGKINYSFLHLDDKVVPQERQSQVLTSIIEFLVAGN